MKAESVALEVGPEAEAVVNHSVVWRYCWTIAVDYVVHYENWTDSFRVLKPVVVHDHVEAMDWLRRELEPVARL